MKLGRLKCRSCNFAGAQISSTVLHFKGMAFRNARDVHISSSTLNQIGGDQINISVGTTQPTRTLIQTLDRLPYVGGASFDPMKVCLQNTRVALLHNLWSWIKSTDTNQTAEISLLTSVAGAGKTAIAHTVAQRCEDEGLLWSSFFFNREVSGRNEAKMLFSTIARDLADRNHDFGEKVADAIDNKKSLVGASTTVHFAELILRPSRCLPVDKPVVIIIDALDEGCDDEVLTILGNGVSNLPGTFRILVTSRIMENLDFHLSEKLHVRPFSIDIDEPANLADSELYARHRLQGVAKRKKLAENWPGPPLFNNFVSRAGGLFIWIFIVSEYLRNAINPDSVLRSLLSKHGLSNISAEIRMDQMYSTILQGCNWDDPDYSRGYGLLMGAMMVAKRPLSLSALQSFHRYDLSTPVKACLQPLASLLTSLDNDHTPVQILHLSLKDFLTFRAQWSPDGQKFFLKEEDHSQRLGYLCLMMMNDELRKCEHAIGYLAHPSELTDVPDIGEDVVSEELLYACSFWIDHVVDVEVPEAKFTDVLHNFLSNHLVSWVEVITSKGRLQNLTKLREWINKIYPNDNVIKNYICNPDVAAAFHKVSWLLSRMDRREEALQAVQEATELRRLVFPKTSSIGFFRRIFRTKNRPWPLNNSTYVANLASSLHSLSHCLSDLRRREEALDVIEEAVELYRQLAKDQPTLYNAGVATSLNMLSRCLTDLGYREEPLEAIKEAVELYRQLAKDRPVVYNTYLASSNHSLSRCLFNLRRQEEALDAIKAAVELYRQLAKDQPVVYNVDVDLAASLNILSRCLSVLGHQEEAFNASKEAVELCRQLAKGRPAVCNTYLASFLWSLSRCLSNIGHREEALDAIKEAVELCRPLTNGRPAVYNTYLTSYLWSLSRCLSDLGHREEALDVIREAVELRRQLAKDHPAVYNAGLAACLDRLSHCLSDLSHREEALDAIKEAVKLYRHLANHRPAVYNTDLSISLQQFSTCLLALGDQEQALDVAREAERAVSI